MSTPPSRPKIYHITHVDNLPGIVAEGGLLSDREMIAGGGPAASIGMSDIKRRRIEELAVDCHPGLMVGDFVPFYFCPRSVMLYVIYRANHPSLAYSGGQTPIVHLEADLHRVTRWAEDNERVWAIALSNAGAYYTEFRSGEEALGQLDWDAIAATDFRSADVKERKQAEFLIYQEFPFQLVERIGVRSAATQRKAIEGIEGADHRPVVEVLSAWYF